MLFSLCLDEQENKSHVIFTENESYVILILCLEEQENEFRVILILFG
jgi:hypothetical protein